MPEDGRGRLWVAAHGLSDDRLASETVRKTLDGE